MKAFIVRGAAALTIGAAALSSTSIAKADNVVVTPQGTQAAPAPAPAPAPVVVAPAAPQTTTTSATVPGPVVVNNGGAPSAEASNHEYIGPNRRLLMSGIIMSGVPYIASVAIAASSNHSGDDNLYIPVVGPWLDIGRRGDCPVGSHACDNETGNKLLLGIDGVFQGIGALQILGAFIFPETREITTVPATAFTPAMTLTPTKMGRSGYGLSAIAEF